MDLANDLPEESSPSMADRYEEIAWRALEKANAATDESDRKVWMGRYEWAKTAAQHWAERYTISTGYAYRGA